MSSKNKTKNNRIFDIVVVGADPLDIRINLAHHGMDVGRRALALGAVEVLPPSCDFGVDLLNRKSRNEEG